MKALFGCLVFFRWYSLIGELLLKGDERETTGFGDRMYDAEEVPSRAQSNSEPFAVFSGVQKKHPSIRIQDMVV